MSCFISKPVAELGAAAKRMAALDFSSSCSIMANDEFGQLTGNLNVMAESLQKALAELEDANEV